MRLSDKQKRIARWVGYPLLGLLTFIYTLHLTFPYDQVKDRFIVEPLSTKYEVTVLDVERTLLPGGMILRSVALRTRPEQPDEKVTTLFLDRVRVKLGLFALLGGAADVDITAELGGGSIDGNVRLSRSGVRARVSTSGLPLTNIPGVQGAVGLPMKGGLHADIDLSLPEGHWDQADGKITLSCNGCTIGDGVTKIKPRAPPGRRLPANVAAFAGEGMTVPELKLGNLSGTVTIEKGRGTIDNFVAKSPDGELALQAAIRFTRQFKDSRFESGCMKFKLSDELKQREPSFGNLPEFMNMSPQTSGYSNVKLKGKLATMRWVPTKECEAGDEGEERVSRSRQRPGITPRVPEEVPKPVENATAGRDSGEERGIAVGEPNPGIQPVNPDDEDGIKMPEVEPPQDKPPHEDEVKPLTDDVAKPELLKEEIDDNRAREVEEERERLEREREEDEARGREHDDDHAASDEIE